ncbi:hypothetical protein [Chitinophaga solisilvae]|uniref:hypothetical protein n=1 Tax=Chitinophaga solisilvae TaxID=1233460 RepID=UPI00136DE9E3|nr:hypothetical protein [Chitinophaga solisilvae]
MENSTAQNCLKCNNTLPSRGYFCGICLSQFKCKSCDSFLEKDSSGCIECGTPKIAQNTSSTQSNTFKVHETLTERIIEATFSDAVGKDLAAVIRDAYGKKMGLPNKQLNELPSEEIRTDEMAENAYEIISEEKRSGDESKSSNQDSKLSTSSQDFPTLKAVTYKNLPSSETEWIVVYSFYASKYGEEEFTRAQITEKYQESNRKTKERLRDMGVYLKLAVKGGYINPLAGTSYSLLEKGLKKAMEIFSRTSSSAPKVKKNSSKSQEGDNSAKADGRKKTSTGGQPKRLPTLDLEPSGKESLKTFSNKFAHKSFNDKNLIFVFYLSEVLGIQNVTIDHIYTCYEFLDLSAPEQFAASLRNTSSVTGHIVTSDKNNITVSMKGKNKIRNWNQNAKQ